MLWVEDLEFKLDSVEGEKGQNEAGAMEHENSPLALLPAHKFNCYDKSLNENSSLGS